MQKKNSISIIIVNYKVKNELLECIKSIYGSKPKVNFEIIVVDNDEKKTIEKDLIKKFPRVKYFKSSKNLGYGAGNNLGAKLAKGEYLFILNPDTKFDNNVIDLLHNFIKRNKKVGAVSPLLIKQNDDPYDPQGSLELTPKNAVFSISIINKFFPDNSVARKFWQRQWDFESTKEVEVCPGTCFLISKKLYEKLGGFDERFFLFFEENDFSRRIKNAGYKLFIYPEAKLYHKLGKSTSKNPNSNKFFQKSRFLYFRKNYGILKAIPTELFLRINKYSLLLLLILLLALILRAYRLSELMHFIGDQGWFYISARDMLLTGDIPLVGITSSHVWLHQGAFWTYILALLFRIFNFNPFVPGYFIAIVDTLTIILVYIFASTLFLKKTALLSSFFYATSPAIVLAARMPYHTSLIPLFTILLLFSVYKWINGKVIYFPISILILGILYNFEIATFSLAGIILILLFFGYLKKEIWLKKIFNKKILFLSFISGLIPLIPFIIYDLNHGFPQTVKVIIWIFYRLAVFLGYPPLNPNAPGETWTTFFIFLQNLIKNFIFNPSKELSILILLIGLLFLFYKTVNNRRKKIKKINYIFILLFILVPAIAYIAAKTNSAAYTLIVFPQLMIMLGILFSFNTRHKIVNLSFLLIAILIGLTNTFVLFKSNFETNRTFRAKIEEAKQIIDVSRGKPYNIIGIGEGSQYESFTTPFEYLTWWQGHGPSKNKEELKFYLNGNTDRIEFREK